MTSPLMLQTWAVLCFHQKTQVHLFFDFVLLTYWRHSLDEDKRDQVRFRHAHCNYQVYYSQLRAICFNLNIFPRVQDPKNVLHNRGSTASFMKFVQKVFVNIIFSFQLSHKTMRRVRFLERHSVSTDSV